MFAGWFYSPWGGDQLFPRTAIEHHMALCRAMGLPQTLSPAELPEPTEAAIEYAVRAVAASDKMFSWSPSDHKCKGDPFIGLYDPPGSWDHYGLHGGRGGAKSTEIAAALVHHARTRKEIIVCARQFQNSIDASSKALIEEQIAEVGAQDEFIITDYDIRHIATGSEFTFIGLDRNVQSIKSRTGVTIVWVEEAEAVKGEAIRILLPTVRQLGSRIIWSWNPEEPDSPVNALLRGDSVPEGAVVHGVNAEHNRYFFRSRLPAEMRSSFARDDIERFRHIWRGAYLEISDVNIFKHVVYGQYLDWNTLKDGGASAQEIGGYDFGYGGQDPSACVRAYVIPAEVCEWEEDEPQRPVLYVVGEGVQRSLPNHELYKLANEAGVSSVFYDSAMPLMGQALSKSGINAYPAFKAPGSLLAGLQALQSMLIVVSPECPETADEIKNLKWEVNPRTEKVKKPLTPVGEDHCVAALRYGLSETDELSLPRKTKVTMR